MSDQLPLIPGIEPDSPTLRVADGVPVGKNGNRLANPMVVRYGAGPEESQCKQCLHLFRTNSRAGRGFFKCRLRGVSGGTATDHRATWPTCGRFER